MSLRRIAARITSRRRTKADFAEQLRIMVDERYPDAELIVLVVDNLNTHGPWVLYEAFSPEEASRISLSASNGTTLLSMALG